jgi:glycosyltransferase involved in cell wall biosynthesis
MRILHFSNAPFSVNQIVSRGQQLNTGGGWIASLLGQIVQIANYKLSCVSFGNCRRIEIDKNDRIECYKFPMCRIEHGLKLCRDFVDDWKPDLIHIHGTEGIYGLLSARQMVGCPVVISLQGLLGPCSEWHRYFGDSTLLDILRMHRWLEFPALRGLWMDYLNIRKSAKIEKEIILGNRYFMGRTTWDKAYIEALNPFAHYFHAGELLRQPFLQKCWDIKRVKRHRIIFTNAGHPRKGTDTILDAVPLLARDFPDIQVCIAGAISKRNGYGKYIRKRINALGAAAVELGQLNAEHMAQVMTESHVFVSPSFVDNSPNAVCEAQLLGMPVISTYTGGLPSLIKEGQTGLLYPAGDAFMLASLLRNIFNDDALAMQLGARSREVACVRHNPDLVVQQVLTAYKNVLGENRFTDPLMENIE